MIIAAFFFYSLAYKVIAQQYKENHRLILIPFVNLVIWSIAAADDFIRGFLGYSVDGLMIAQYILTKSIGIVDYLLYPSYGYREQELIPSEQAPPQEVEMNDSNDDDSVTEEIQNALHLDWEKETKVHN